MFLYYMHHGMNLHSCEIAASICVVANFNTAKRFKYLLYLNLLAVLKFATTHIVPKQAETN